jgi:hypothetical protein
MTFPSEPTMRAIESSTALQLTSTSQLDALASVYALASNCPHLRDFERSATLRGIQAGLTDRNVSWKTGVRFASQIEQLQAALEDKEEQIFQLEFKIRMLEDELKEAKKNGQAKVKA